MVRRVTRPEFDNSLLYEYPQHLRDAISDLPAAPGVYVFHGEDGGLPLYIGKSVNLRSRVLSHLRTVEEARMLRQTVRISHYRTAGEIGALLLEAAMIKQQFPLLNQRLRRTRQLCSLRIDGRGRPEVVYSKDVDFATTPDLFGLFGSRTSAVNSLRALADENQLCYGVLGLERLSKGRGCFRSMLRHCAGACSGKETVESHQSRLMAALERMRVQCWPHDGAVGLVERFDGQPGPMTQIHVIRNWCYLGSAESVGAASALTGVAAGFDVDGYKILCRPMLASGTEIVDFSAFKPSVRLQMP